VFLRDTLKAILADQKPQETTGPELPRDLAEEVRMRPGQALVLTGVRRCGKSVLQAQLMREYAHAFYCNLEDTRLFGLSPADFPLFLTLVEETSPKGAPVFLDEVQEVDEWQRLVRSLLDRGRKVCVTGSNASLLGRELGAKLTGRQLTYEVFPFNYSEYLRYRGLKPGAGSFAGYLDAGGFPTFLLEPDSRVLQELLRDIVQRDIAFRHKLRETRHVMNLALFLLANTGHPYSMQSLTKALAIPAVGQTSRYLEYLEDAYLLFALPRFSASFKQRVVAPCKYYAVDNGLRLANSPQRTPDIGHRLENAVFLALRERKTAMGYTGEKDSWECDFVTDAEAIQVCVELTPFNQDREIRGALRGASLPGRKRRPLILTLDQRDNVEAEGARINVLPVSEWLLT
jgi:hypothetical protein